MTERARFHCLNCGHEFDNEVLTEDEKLEYRRGLRRGGPVHCPRCNRTDVCRDGLRRAS